MAGDEKKRKKDDSQTDGGGRRFSEKEKGDTANVLISFFDSRVADYLRKRVAPMTPDWMRSSEVRQLAGPFRALIEVFTGDKHWLIKTFGEKVGSDYLDMLFTILGGEPEKTADGGKKATGRLADFFTYADNRLREADSPEAEWERLKVQFRLRQELEVMIEEALNAAEHQVPETEEPEREPTNWDAVWRTIDEGAESLWKGLGDAVGSATRPLDAWSDCLEGRARRKGRI